MWNSLATRRANGSFCSTRRIVTPGLPIQPQDDLADLVDDVRLDAFGRLVENQQRRLEHQRPPDRQLLLLPARQVAALPSQHLLEHRKQLEDPRRNGPRPVLANAEPEAKILLDGQLRKNVAALRHVADAEPRARLGREGATDWCRRTSPSPRSPAAAP